MKKTLIIAEAGVNHNGSITMAKKMIDVAADAGVDYVKFQTFKASNLVTKFATRADYQQQNMEDNDNLQYSISSICCSGKSSNCLSIVYCKLSLSSIFCC